MVPAEYTEYLESGDFTYENGSLYFHGLKLNADGMYEYTDDEGEVWLYDPLDPEFLQYFGDKAGVQDVSGAGNLQQGAGSSSGASFRGGIDGGSYRYPSYADGKEVINGVDVSYYQQSINWSKLASKGVKFAIIRAGYRGYGDSGNMREDPMCRSYIEGASAAGIKVGIYFLSQAKNREEAVDEARKCGEIINEYKDRISLPVFIDYEYAGSSSNPGRLYKQHQSDWNSGGDYRAIHTDVINGFMDKISSYGYEGGVYCNRSMLESQLYVSSISSKHYIWLANYTTSTPYSDRLECWQYTSTYSGFGASGAVGSKNMDLDFWFGRLPGEESGSGGTGQLTDVSVSYRTHVQDIGWQDYKSNGEAAGTSGRSLRLEGINIKVTGRSGLGVQYTTHCQDHGWLSWSSNDEMNGTEGESRRLEAIMIKLTGSDRDRYDIWYRVHAQDVGWMGWAKNGAPAGTAGYSRRLEAIQIVVSDKGAAFNTSLGGISSVTSSAYLDANNGGDPHVPNADIPNLSYRTHVENEGWQTWKKNGEFAGTSGRSLRLEGINIRLTNKDHSGGIRYKTHVQDIGWQDWKYDGDMSGTSGRSLRLEAINIELTGEMASYYDIYYRVHAQDVGWMGWAKNGASSGTAGYSRRLEGIQIVLVAKGNSAPGNSYNGISSDDSRAFISR
ncbi:MAG: hypothetical protein J5966_02255 [Lachnospiraceae bacterium]|nr:hypothetical protein [Lachnospiraceae bacterium]